MHRATKLLVLRPGTIDSEKQRGVVADNEFRTVRLRSLDCVRRTAIGIRYGLESTKGYDLIVLPVSELACIALLDGVPPAIVAYGPVEQMEPALLMGAVDYLVEPWTLDEMRVRVRRVLSEYPGVGRFDGYGGTIVIENTYPFLPPRERSALEILSRHAGRIVDRETLALSVGIPIYNLRTGSRAVDMVISRLRRMLGRHGSRVETIRGVGYRFRVDNRWINTVPRGEGSE